MEPFKPNTVPRVRHKPHVVVVTNTTYGRMKKVADQWDMTYVALVDQCIMYALDNMTQKNPRSKP